MRAFEFLFLGFVIGVMASDFIKKFDGSEK